MINNILSNKKKLIIIVGILIGMVLLIIFILNFDGNDNRNAYNFKKDYESLNGKDLGNGNMYPEVNISENNKMRYVSYDEVFDVLDNNGNAVIYIGYSKCLYCRTAAQVLTDTAKDMNIDEILYLDVEVKGSDGYGRLVDTFKDNFFVGGLSQDKFYVPSVLFVVNGSVVSSNKGTLDSHKSPYDILDQSQIDGLSSIYRRGINDVIFAKNGSL